LVVSNCGDHALALVLGGQYNFKHCTFANYFNDNPRSKPILLLSNYSESSEGDLFKRDLDAYFGNSIIHGALDSELQREREKGARFDYLFEEVILKLDTENIDNVDHFIGILKNPALPLFQDPSKNDYELVSGSKAVNEGVLMGVPLDLLGMPRDGTPDLGAYELIP